MTRDLRQIYSYSIKSPCRIK